VKTYSLLKLTRKRFKADHYYKENEKSAEEFYNEWESDGYRSVSLLVKCRDEKSKLGKKAAEVLSHLTGMFNMNAEYNG
jgi:hypothetical protein